MRKYNRYELLNLIERSAGSRTLKSFAEDAGLSPDYLYRLFKGRFADSPRRSTLKKISDASLGKVSYSELLSAAGYDEDASSRTYPFSDKLSSIKATLLLLLANSTLKWGINNEEQRGFLTINCESTSYKKWSFIFMDYHKECSRKYAQEKECKESALLRLGAYYYSMVNKSFNNSLYPVETPVNLAAMLMPFIFSNIDETEKISFVTESVSDYNLCKEQFLDNLKMNISVILIDSSNTNNISETVLCTAEGNSKDSIKIF